MASSETIGSRDFLERIAQQVVGRSGAQAVFAPPIERGGVTVVPVAKVRYGFGGGIRKEEGEGGGGGGAASPVGFIQLRDGTASFRSIRDPLAVGVRSVAIMLGLGVGLLLLLNGRRLFGR